jgi:hypothetical protein
LRPTAESRTTVVRVRTLNRGIRPRVTLNTTPRRAQAARLRLWREDVIRIEGSVDAENLRVVLSARADDSLPAGTNIRIAAGVTDLRRGFTGLSAVAQTRDRITRADRWNPERGPCTLVVNVPISGVGVCRMRISACSSSLNFVD